MYAVAAPLKKGARRLACDCSPMALGYQRPLQPRARAWRKRLGAIAPTVTSRRVVNYPLATFRTGNSAVGPEPIIRGPVWGAQPPTTGTGGNWRGWRNRISQGLNPAGGPTSMIDSYDASGNPVYSVPPPGAIITGYDAQGTPIYNNQASYTSSSQQQALIAQYEALQNAGAGGSAAAAPPSATATTTTASSGYSDILDWLSENTLIAAVPNWVVAGGAGLAALWLMNRGRR
jgi:hypothetical protein